MDPFKKKYTLEIEFEKKPNYVYHTESSLIESGMVKPACSEGYELGRDHYAVENILRKSGLSGLKYSIFSLKRDHDKLKAERDSYKLKYELLKKELGDDKADVLALPDGIETTPESLEWHKREYVRVCEPMETMKEQSIKEMESLWKSGE